MNRTRKRNKRECCERNIDVMSNPNCTNIDNYKNKRYRCYRSVVCTGYVLRTKVLTETIEYVRTKILSHMVDIQGHGQC